MVQGGWAPCKRVILSLSLSGNLSPFVLEFSSSSFSSSRSPRSFSFDFDSSVESVPSSSELVVRAPAVPITSRRCVWTYSEWAILSVTGKMEHESVRDRVFYYIVSRGIANANR